MSLLSSLELFHNTLVLVESISIRDEGPAMRRHVPIQIRRAKRGKIVNEYLLLAEPLCVAKVPLHLHLSVVWTRSAHSYQFPADLEPLAPWRLAPPERDAPQQLQLCKRSFTEPRNQQTTGSRLITSRPRAAF